MFEPISPRESAVDACFGEMRRAILDGELAPGDRLPPERSLAETFGVNRVTVRSALGRLASARLVSVRQGSGYVVRDFRRHGGPELLTGLARAAGAEGGLVGVVGDLLLVRRQLAGAVLTRLVEAADDAAIDAVEEAVQRFAAEVERGGGSETIARADVEVVAAILDGTRSPVLGLCLNPILAVLSELEELREAIYASPGDNLAGWRLLIEALRSRNVDAVRAMVGELEGRDARTVERLRQLAPHLEGSQHER